MARIEPLSVPGGGCTLVVDGESVWGLEVGLEVEADGSERVLVSTRSDSVSLVQPTMTTSTEIPRAPIFRLITSYDVFRAASGSCIVASG